MYTFKDKVKDALEAEARKIQLSEIHSEVLRELGSRGSSYVPEVIQVQDDPLMVFSGVTVKDLRKEFPPLPVVEVRTRGAVPVHKLHAFHLRQLTGRQISDVSYMADHAYWSTLIGETVWEIRVMGQFRGIPVHPVEVTEATLDAWSKAEAREAEVQAEAERTQAMFKRIGYGALACSFLRAGFSLVKRTSRPLTLSDLPPSRGPADLKMIAVHSPDEAIHAIQAYSNAQLQPRHPWDRIGDFWRVFTSETAKTFVDNVNKYPYL